MFFRRGNLGFQYYYSSVFFIVVVNEEIMKKLVSIKIFCLIIKSRFLKLFFFFAFLIFVNPIKAAETETGDRERPSLEDVVTGRIKYPLDDSLGLGMGSVGGDEGITSLENDYYIGILVEPFTVNINDLQMEEDLRGPGLSFGTDDEVDENEPVGTLLLGKELVVDGVPIKLDIGALDNRPKDTRETDFENLEEGSNADKRWLVTARAGLEQKLGLATLFANGGLVMVRTPESDQVISIKSDEPQQGNSGPSSRHDYLRLGWVVGAGIEVPLNKRAMENIKSDGAWMLQLEGSHVSLAEEAYTIGSSRGGGACGAVGLHRPCFQSRDSEVTFLGVVIVRRFSL